MGKKIIVKGADFSANKITYTDISSTAVISRNGTFFINYPNNNQANRIGYSSSATTQNLITLNVSAYQGKYIRITITSIYVSEDYTGGAYSLSFASNLNFTTPYTGTTAMLNAITNVGNIPTTEGFVAKTLIAKIPDNAVYLVCANRNNIVPNPKFEILD